MVLRTNTTGDKKWTTLPLWKEKESENSQARERQEKSLYDTASVMQINLIIELKRSMAESS